MPSWCNKVGADDRNSQVRVGLHALDRSYAQMYLAFRTANVSISWSAAGADGLRLLVEPVVGSNLSNFAVVLSADFAWSRQGWFFWCTTFPDMVSSRYIFVCTRVNAHDGESLNVCVMCVVCLFVGLRTVCCSMHSRHRTRCGPVNRVLPHRTCFQSAARHSQHHHSFANQRCDHHRRLQTERSGIPCVRAN